MFYPKKFLNYRDWTKRCRSWRHYWFRLVNRGVLGTAVLVGLAVDHLRSATEAE